jgi:hypothetical protein
MTTLFTGPIRRTFCHATKPLGHGKKTVELTL